MPTVSTRIKDIQHTVDSNSPHQEQNTPIRLGVLVNQDLYPGQYSTNINITATPKRATDGYGGLTRCRTYIRWDHHNCAW